MIAFCLTLAVIAAVLVCAITWACCKAASNADAASQRYSDQRLEAEDDGSTEYASLYLTPRSTQSGGKI